jgi:hypothetical protein
VIFLQEGEIGGLFVDKLVVILTGESRRRLGTSLVYGKKKGIGEGRVS